MPRAPVDPRRRCLKFSEWPERDRLLWEENLKEGDLFSENAYTGSRNPQTLSKTQDGYGRFLGALVFLGLFDPKAEPGSRVTPAVISAYFKLLRETNISDFTLTGRLNELRDALHIIAPDRDFRWITAPGGVPIRSRLDMSVRSREWHHSLVLYRWGLRLMDEALKRSPVRRRVKFRDGLMITLLACFGPRLRSLTCMRLGHNVVRHGAGYRLIFFPEDTKNRKHLEYQMPADLIPYVDRYLSVERLELLNGTDADAFWVNWGGARLEEAGVEKRIWWQSGKEFGKPFGPHRFRHALITTQVISDPSNPGIGPAILGITDSVAEAHYNMAAQIEVALKHNDGIAAERRLTEASARNTLRSTT